MNLRQYSVFPQAQGVCGWYSRYPARIKLFAEARLSVVSETTALHPLCRARDSSARIRRNWSPLPQPRSRMALAAETLAAGVASLFCITPTRTLSALLVWLRARERISMGDL